MIFFALSAIISFLLSGKASLYSKQLFTYSKLSEDAIESEDEKNAESEVKISVTETTEETEIKTEPESEKTE